MEWLNAFTAAACALSAILAWIAKIFWSKEFASAKNEIIKTKDAQITLLEREVLSLKELTPMKIREYFLSVRDQLEEFNEGLKKQLVDAKSEIENRDKKIAQLTEQDGNQQDLIKVLEHEKTNLESTLKALELIEQGTSQDKNKIWNNWVNFNDNMLIVEKNINQSREYIAHIYKIAEKDNNKFELLLKNLKSSLLVGVTGRNKEIVSSNKNNP